MKVCALCDDFIANGCAVKWGRSPWGDGDDWAHFKCADNYEPSDEDIEAHNNAGYPTLRELQEAAWEQKRKLHR